MYMNNFVFSQDPILYGSTIPQFQQDPSEIKKQLDVVMAQYQQLQQNKVETPPTPTPIDYLSELDNILSGLDQPYLDVLNSNQEFLELHQDIQHIIQSELMSSIKWKVNSNPNVAPKVDKIKHIINNIKKDMDSERRKSMDELNDYIQNYSDMTFNEYKKIKAARG